ncbi:hypothetical protein HDU86_006514 [Geranomyces michiganensis]|nr:hypothetical protein HDU86_006514 [Geranomyces michiganensis]
MRSFSSTPVKQPKPASGFIHIRELDEHRIEIILASLKDRKAYDQLKQVILAENPAESSSRFSNLDGAHRVAAVKRYNTQATKKIDLIPAVVLKPDISKLERALLAVALNSSTQATSKDKFTDQMTAIATFRQLFVEQNQKEPNGKELAALAQKGGMTTMKISALKADDGDRGGAGLS